MANVVCAVGGGKGGVGRTTSAINIGAALEQYDYDTVVVDADLSMSDLGLTLGIDVDSGIHSVLAGQASLGEATVDLPGGLTVIPGERDLESYAAAETAGLREVVDVLRETYDVVLLDTGASLSRETSIALDTADSVLLVVTPDDSAVNNALKTKQLTERLDSDVAGVLLTHVRDSGEIDSVAERIDVPVLGGIPVDDEAVGEEPLMVKALDSTAAEAYGEIAHRFDSVAIQGVPPEEIEPAFEDGWVTDLESPESLREAASADGATEGAADESADEEPESEPEEDDDGPDEFTGGAGMFG